jgi:O-antigen ligase
VLERQAHWQAGLDMLRDEIALGVGFGNYADAYAQYALINWPDPLGHAHNYYINLLAEVGVVGLATYLFFWTAVFWQTIRLLRYLDWPDRGIAMGLLAAWVALAAHHLVDKLYVNNIYIHLGVMLGLLQLLDLYMAEVRGTSAKLMRDPISTGNRIINGKCRE